MSGVPGAPLENRRQLLVKLCWMALWMVYLLYPVQDLARGHYSTTAVVVGSLALAAFVGCYLGLVAFRSWHGTWWRGSYPVLAVMLALAIATPFGYGEAWLGLFTYVSVALGAVLPPRYSLWGVGANTVLFVAVALAVHAQGDTLGGLLLPTFLSGAAMTGVQRLITTMRELREARLVAAHLAASEERLRLARDMHDLLGHSLSLITLKSELARRFMDAGKQEQARDQVTEIEQVARQSLADVRAAISGYRKPTLSVELAAARTALATTGVTLEAPSTLLEAQSGLGGPESEALAWALREAVTNVVRHAAGATQCTVALDQTWDADGARYAVLEVADDGRGPGRSAPGNGLTGLDERLALVGGRLERGPGPHGKGFAIRALVPLGVRVRP
ncbi:sensor histidine kinase [Streptomyces tateyamensis]|uniref:Sensor histidine kinase n=2 Tax=Streptomyces tateyamensis TaxID=565073 RepID=A0A2V4N7N0_9ACTN|nr:sensor histidine kinase [Streptomyces tateyamensis]